MSLAYQFIWDGKRGISWALMVLPKSEGGLGVRDLPIITRLANVKRVAKFWSEEDQSILSLWIQQRYIKGRAFADVQTKNTIDSAFWKSFLSGT